MAQFSKVERDIGAGFVEDVAIHELTYEASLFGFIRTITVILGNANSELPTISSGTTTASGSTTTVTNSAGTFFSDFVQPGDRVTNTADSNAIWEVVSVDSETQLTVQLLISGGGEDDWDSGETYTIQRRNQEDVYIPFTTPFRVTNRDTNQIMFEGVVQEAIPLGINGGSLKVIAVSRESELRDGAPQSDAGGLDARSAVMQDAIDQKSADTGSFLFPLVSSFEGEPGLDHSPNQNTINPDYSKSSRPALAQFIDNAKAEAWCLDVIDEPSQPWVTATTEDTDNELKVEPRGSLAQAFEVTAHGLLTKINLHLDKVEAVGGNLDATNIYVRIEANDSAGEVGAGTPGSDIPSGELVTPWAESEVVGVVNVSDALLGFVFSRPIALRKDTKYWIVLSYQEDLNAWSSGVDYVSWVSDSAAGYAFDRAEYASGFWTITASDNHAFTINEHADAVWAYDFSGDAWTDLTTEASADDASRLTWMNADLADRKYIRTAGPLLGLELQLDSTLATSDDYGAHTFKYYGSNRAKIVGEHSLDDDNVTTLTDSGKDFFKTGAAVGDLVHNITDDSYGIITSITATTLVCGDLAGGNDNTFALGDTYAVLNLETVASGTATSGSSTTCGDTGAKFDELGVREGDILVNVTDSRAAKITLYAEQLLTAASAGGGLSFAASDLYKVLSRWRTLTLKETNITFEVAGTVRFEWDMPSDWVPTFLEAGMPEASSTGFATVDDMRGYWLSVMVASVPDTTLAVVDLVTPIPGSGFVLQVTDETHDDVILAEGAADGGGGNAAFLTDVSEDFIADHGILVGDIVDNLTDGSTATVTGFDTEGTNPNNIVTGTLAGGAENDWDSGDVYRFRRARYRVRYFRNGSRPLGLPANFGLTLRQGGGRFKQMRQIASSEFPKSTRASVNRVIVRGKTAAGAAIDGEANNLRAQREFKRVISATIYDYSIKLAAECVDRAEAELRQFTDQADRGNVMVYSYPYFTKTLERKAWNPTLTNIQRKLDGNVYGVYIHNGGAVTSLVDTSQNFKKWNVKVGDLLTNVTQDVTATITAISTTTNESDTLEGVLTGAVNWANNDKYRVEERTLLQVGDLIQVKVNDPGNIDADYMVVGIKYYEPSFECHLRLAKSLVAPTVGDQQTGAEVDQKTRDLANMALQRGSYD